MFTCELDSVVAFKNSIETISELVDEVFINITKDGIKILSADRAVVVVVDFFMSKDMFKKYKYKEETRIGVNLLNILQVLRRTKSTDSLKMSTEEDKLIFKLIGNVTRTFTLPLVDISQEELPPIEKLQFNTKFLIDTETLNEAIEDVAVIADSVVFEAEKNNITIRASSDSSVVETKLSKDSIGIYEINATQPTRARYSIDYLKKIIKARKLVDKVKIEFSSDYPMKMTFDANTIRLSFILAPRVEEV